MCRHEYVIRWVNMEKGTFVGCLLCHLIQRSPQPVVSTLVRPAIYILSGAQRVHKMDPMYHNLHHTANNMNPMYHNLHHTANNMNPMYHNLHHTANNIPN